MIWNCLLILTISLPVTIPFGFGGHSEPLYNENDVGINLLSVDNFKATILNSETAWMVEFYSSWCGHCIRFAPTFKEMAKYTAGKVSKCSKIMQNYAIQAVSLHSGWKSMMRVGAIDCAQDENVPVICHYLTYH